jgi:DNA-binding GntR family transcriptional regulator
LPVAVPRRGESHDFGLPPARTWQYLYSDIGVATGYGSGQVGYGVRAMPSEGVEVAETQVGSPAIRADYPEPLWIQAVNLISEEIRSGALKPGMRLPPERELCLQLNISRVTLRKALNHLVEEGILTASHGRGWYVAARADDTEWPNSLESFSETAARMGLVPSSIVLRAEVAPATFDEAEGLAIAPGTPLFHLVRVRRLDGVPIALDSTDIPLSVAPGLPALDFTAESLYDSLAAAGVQPMRADTMIEAAEADEVAAQCLNLTVGKPLLIMRQTVVDRSERHLFVSTIKYVGERYRLRTFFTRSISRAFD